MGRGHQNKIKKSLIIIVTLFPFPQLTNVGFLPFSSEPDGNLHQRGAFEVKRRW